MESVFGSRDLTFGRVQLMVRVSIRVNLQQGAASGQLMLERITVRVGYHLDTLW